MKIKINLITIVGFLGLILIGILIILSMNSHPSFDDYAWPVWIKEMGWFNTQDFVYHAINGRVLSTLISTLTMTDPGYFLKYKLFCFLFLIIFLMSLYRLTRLMSFNTEKPKSIHFSFFSLVLYSIFLIIPESSSLFFWLTGVIVYSTTLILFFLLLSYFEIVDQNINPKIRKKYIYFSLGICAIIPLFSELGVFLISPLLIYKIVSTRAKLKEWNLFLISLLLVLCSSMVINYIGSQTRITNLNQVTHNQDFYKSISLLLRSLVNYTTSYHALSLLVINIALFCFIQVNNINKRSLFGVNSPHVLFCLGILTFIFGLFVSIFILGVKAPPRVWNLLIVPMEIFFISAFVVSQHKNEIKFSYKKTIFIFFFTSSLILPTTLRQICGDLFKGKVFFYNRFMNRQYVYSKECKSDTLHLKKIESIKKPMSMMFKQGAGFAQNSKSDDWYYNVYYAKYFKKQIVYQK